MSRVVVYSSRPCSFCERAKSLLRARGITFDDVDLAGDAEARAALQARTGWMTVPQIFIDGEFIGGYEQLAALDRAGELDRVSLQC